MATSIPTFNAPLPTTYQRTTGPREGNPDDICPLCRESPIAADAPSIMHLPCRHRFHEECFGEMLKHTSPRDLQCPMCRAPLPLSALVDVEEVSSSSEDSETDSELSSTSEGSGVLVDDDTVADAMADLTTDDVMSLDDDADDADSDVVMLDPASGDDDADNDVVMLDPASEDDEADGDEADSDEDSDSYSDDDSDTYSAVLSDMTASDVSLDVALSEEYIDPADDESDDEDMDTSRSIWYGNPLHPMHESCDRDFI